MTDIVILVIGAGCAAFFAGLLVLCDRGGPVILEILTGIAALFVFIYLLWALLRPEDF